MSGLLISSFTCNGLADRRKGGTFLLGLLMKTMIYSVYKRLALLSGMRLSGKKSGG